MSASAQDSWMGGGKSCGLAMCSRRSPTLNVFDFTRISGGKSSDTAFPDCPYMCPLCRRSLHTQIAVANAILLTIHLKSRAIVIVLQVRGNALWEKSWKRLRR